MEKREELINEIKVLVETVWNEIDDLTNGTRRVTSEEAKDDILNIGNFEFKTVNIEESVSFLVGPVAAQTKDDEGNVIYTLEPNITIQHRDREGFISEEYDYIPDSDKAYEEFINTFLHLSGEPRPFDPFIPIMDYGVEPSTAMKYAHVKVEVISTTAIELEVPENFNDEQIEKYINDRLPLVPTPVETSGEKKIKAVAWYVIE